MPHPSWCLLVGVAENKKMREEIGDHLSRFVKCCVVLLDDLDNVLLDVNVMFKLEYDHIVVGVKWLIQFYFI